MEEFDVSLVDLRVDEVELFYTVDVVKDQASACRYFCRTRRWPVVKEPVMF
jgi:hypothetical protein